MTQPKPWLWDLNVEPYMGVLPQIMSFLLVGYGDKPQLLDHSPRLLLLCPELLTLDPERYPLECRACHVLIMRWNMVADTGICEACTEGWGWKGGVECQL